jgi:hypothetical protein
MTTVSVPISDAAKQRLDRRASEQGLPLEEFARTILEREATVPQPGKSVDEWIADWRSWTSTRPRRDIQLDDSREAIYEGRGE